MKAKKNMNKNERKELCCNRCKKKRILSYSEAEQDGWVMSIEYRGLICNQCIEKYGIPTTFLGMPARILPNDNGNFKVEYDSSVEHEVKQRF